MGSVGNQPWQSLASYFALIGPEVPKIPFMVVLIVSRLMFTFHQHSINTA
jgi:hypothetical protein